MIILFLGELEFEVGDVIELLEKHQVRDGYQRGTNLRTGKIGNFPLYKTKDVLNVVNYPEYY